VATLLPADYGRLSLILAIYNTVWIVGASGLPNSVARYLAMATPKDDPAIVRSAVRAGVLPTVVATIIVATASGILLNSTLAFFFAVIGLPSLVYSLLAMGILRGRSYMGLAASIMPIAAVGEVGPLAIMKFSEIGITPLSAFGVFCLGNALGLAVGVVHTIRTSPSRVINTEFPETNSRPVPTPRELLGFSIWLGIATVGVALLPLIIRSAAALDSYTTVAIIDVALVLLALPQRVGIVLVQAVVPHATRALGEEKLSLTISRREHIWMIAPFFLAAGIVAFTPLVGWLFGLLGRPEYEQSSRYLAMALIASPARVLYGLVEGILIAHKEGRFLAFTALAITIVASGLIFAATVLSSMIVAFAVFVAAFWLIYLVGYARIRQLTSASISARDARFVNQASLGES
jgi:O-antigen/teichoic acid export membrane protein